MVKISLMKSFTMMDKKSLVPIELLVLISMLIDGVSIDNQAFSQELLSAFQLIVYHFGNRKTLEAPSKTFGNSIAYIYCLKNLCHCSLKDFN